MILLLITREIKLLLRVDLHKPSTTSFVYLYLSNGLVFWYIFLKQFYQCLFLSYFHHLASPCFEPLIQRFVCFYSHFLCLYSYICLFCIISITHYFPTSSRLHFLSPLVTILVDLCILTFFVFGVSIIYILLYIRFCLLILFIIPHLPALLVPSSRQVSPSPQKVLAPVHIPKLFDPLFFLWFVVVLFGPSFNIASSFCSTLPFFPSFLLCSVSSPIIVLFSVSASASTSVLLSLFSWHIIFTSHLS